MKQSIYLSICTVVIAMTTFAGCATAGASTAGKAVATTQKVAKQRTVVTKVPVLVKETSFYSDGLVDQYIVYKLDDAKKLLLEKATYDGSRSDPVERLVFEYKDGRETVETVYESDGKVRNRRESVYDDKGALVSERVLDSKGAIQSSSSYTYDAKGRKTEWRVLDASGSVKASTSYAYGKDSLSGIEMKDVGGKVTGTIKLEYAAGKLDKRSYFDPDGALQKYEAYVYSGELLSSLESHRADGSLEAKIVYEYGDSGQLVKASEYDASGALRSSTSYEYIVREDSSTETYYE